MHHYVLEQNIMINEIIPLIAISQVKKTEMEFGYALEARY